MELKSYSFTAPGSMMLFGEHAVLHNRKAIVCAINKYIKVDLLPRSDRKIHIISSAYPEVYISLDKLEVAKPYDYVLSSIKQYLTKISCGFTLKIKSDFTQAMGLGSSAAVVVAVLGVLALWLDNDTPNRQQLYNHALAAVSLVQNNLGSGADVAASVFGGVVVYRKQPLVIEKLDVDLPITAIYSGKKVETPLVIAKVLEESAKFPKIFDYLYDAIDCCVEHAITAIENNDLNLLGRLINIGYGLQESLGVNNYVLSQLVHALRMEQKNGNFVYGAKISGSGLGDCVIGLGNIATNTFPQDDFQKKQQIRQIDLNIDHVGAGIYDIA